MGGARNGDLGVLEEALCGCEVSLVERGVGGVAVDEFQGEADEDVSPRRNQSAKMRKKIVIEGMMIMMGEEI
ncbi:hypothetical protein SASPL_144436 [Salvia splendens]|uniref:Uncharacterized protein n=1 Tax=Salvia splendens TaxID=180675 RepID=A0A8X8WF90_SALSN|nr:hypothetical protein SASPL_144436 [Salvia splendens]